MTIRCNLPNGGCHRLLKRAHDKDHLLTMTMYNEYRKSKENWKQIDKYMEENENDDKAVS